MTAYHILIFSAACLMISEGADIINGRAADPHSRPYMAYITITDSKLNKFFCGGTLIYSKWVVTAAHCEIPEGEATVILGAHSSQENAAEQGRQKIYVKKFFKHPYYNIITMRNDILLMELNITAKLGKFVRSISLPETFEDIEAGTVCETAGWGWTGYDYAKVLMEVNVTVLDRSECRIPFKNVVNITENMMCTKVGPERQDICSGDSGGPLICKGVFRGVVSFGTEPCGKFNGAAVYTRLTEEYVNWIKTTIRHQL